MASFKSIGNTAACAAGLAILVLVSACGVYTFNPSGKSSLATIAVEQFDNATEQYGLADQVTVTVIDAFIDDGRLKVVSNDVAEAILIGTLTSYRRAVYEFDENDQVAQYKVVVGFDIALQDPTDQSEIWAINLTLDGVYDAESQTEEDGQADVGRQLVESVLNKTTKSW